MELSKKGNTVYAKVSDEVVITAEDADEEDED